MDFLSKDDSLDFEESLYQDLLSPRGPTRARRRQSDAKWRASVATCYDTLKHVVPKAHRASKRKVSKAVILQESEKHIMHLENVLSRLIGPESQSKDKTVLWKEDNQWEKCTLRHFQEDFVHKQYKIFHSSNQGRRCYNLLDEIKEEIFSMRVDPTSVSVVDKKSFVAASSNNMKAHGKGVSRFSQFPISQIGNSKDKLPVVSTWKSSDACCKHNLQQNYSVENSNSSITDCYSTNDTLIPCEDQTVPSLSSVVPTLSQSHGNNSDDTPNAICSSTISTLFSNPLSESVVSTVGYTIHDSCQNQGKEDLMGFNHVDYGSNQDEAGDQEVPSFDNTDTVLPGTSGNSPFYFTDKLLRVNEKSNASNTTDRPGKKMGPFITLTPTLTPTPAKLNVVKDGFENNSLKTPANTASLETFQSKFTDSSSLFRQRPLTENGKDPVNKTKTARKLNFNRPECVQVHQSLSDQQKRRSAIGMSPMLAGFTPIKLSPNVSYCITCKRPDESLVSPWKSLHSPLYEEDSKKPQDKSPMIDPDNSLFCFETMDDSTNDDKEDTGVSVEKTPAHQCEPVEDNPAKQTFKRKITCKSFDPSGKQQPKCRKKLDGTFVDGNVCKSPALDPKPSTSKGLTDEDCVVPDCKVTNVSQGEEEGETDMGAFEDVARLVTDNADVVDFDGFFFYFRQISQQLKEQQKLSCKEILSPCVASKVLKMWLRLTSPDKQTIQTLALLDSQNGAESLSQDLEDVQVEPIDLTQFIIPSNTSPI